MMPTFPRTKAALRRVARQLGIRIDRYSLETSHELRLAHMLRWQGIDLVLDVGASTGGYATALRTAGYRGRILSFEPLAAAHRDLLRRSSRDAQWAVAPRMAIGDHDGSCLMNVASNSDSSSLLPMLETHADAAPESRYVDVETVSVRRLDGVDHPFVSASKRLFLKVDTQGYEAKVLAGAFGLMPKVQGLQLEMSLEPLYAEQALWFDLIKTVELNGFKLWSLVPGFFSTKTGKLLQCDGIFFREGTGPQP